MNIMNIVAKNLKPISMDHVRNTPFYQHSIQMHTNAYLYLKTYRAGWKFYGQHALSEARMRTFLLRIEHFVVNLIISYQIS